MPVHRPKKQRPAGDERIKAEQDKQRREEAIANAVGLRVLSAIVAAVPVRLTKRDLVFIVERLLPSWRSGASRFSPGAAASRRCKRRQHRKADGAYIHKAEEGELGRLLVETVILHSARTQSETGKALKDAALHYKVDTDAIAQKVKSEFAAKEKAQATKKTAAKVKPKPAKPTAVKRPKPRNAQLPSISNGVCRRGPVLFRPSSHPLMCRRFAPDLVWPTDGLERLIQCFPLPSDHGLVNAIAVGAPPITVMAVLVISVRFAGVAATVRFGVVPAAIERTVGRR